MNSNNKDFPLKACIKFIESCKKGYLKDDNPFIKGDKEEGFKISDDSMFRIPECEDFRRLGFVDGGTGIIIRSSDFSISFTRVAGVLFEDKKFHPIFWRCG